MIVYTAPKCRLAVVIYGLGVIGNTMLSKSIIGGSNPSACAKKTRGVRMICFDDDFDEEVWDILDKAYNELFGIYKPKVIFNGNTTIYVDEFGKKWVAKCEKGDKFDKEKGLLVAVLKSKGVKTSRILSLLDDAIDYGKVDADKAYKKMVEKDKKDLKRNRGNK